MSNNPTAPAPGPPPAQPLAPGNFDRAWNDPPMFSYSTSATAQPITANRLNKRIAFPTNQSQAPVPGSGQDPTAPPKLYDAGMKPPPGSILPPPPSIMTPAPPSSTSSSSSDEIDVDAIEKNFEQLVIQNMTESARCDFTKRLKVLFSAWRQGTYNIKIQTDLRDIAQSLMDNNMSAAEERFTILSADWSSVIGPSNILVIKKLINVVKEQSENVNTENAVTKPL